MMKDYDDPYSFLAVHLLFSFPPPVVARMLVDDDFLYKLLLKEMRGQDFRGPFLDCVITEILVNKKRMAFMRELDKVSEYLFSELDLIRLRNKIIKYANKYNILVI